MIQNSHMIGCTLCAHFLSLPHFDVMGPISEEIQDNIDRISLLLGNYRTFLSDCASKLMMLSQSKKTLPSTF